MQKLTKGLIALGLAALTSGAMAASVNPYTYNNTYKNAINDAKWQRGYNSERQCERTGCSSTMGTSSNLSYVWVNDSNGQMQFSTNGSKSEKWRSELRFLDNFSRGSSRTMTARLGYWASRSNSEGFTVAQLHMDTNEGWDVKGPPARLEIIDEDHFRVDFRSGYSCTSGCWTKEEFSTSTSNWKNIQLQTSGDYINVSVQGETHSYYLKGTGRNWPSQGGYYWKTGIYLQDGGTAYTGYKNLYW